MLDLVMETLPTGPQVGDAEAHTSFAGAAQGWSFVALPASYRLAGVALHPLSLRAVAPPILSRKGRCQKQKCLEAQGWGPMEGVDGLLCFIYCHLGAALFS